MKIYSAAAEDNEMAKLEPARYFNLAIEQINDIKEWMRTSSEGVQPLLVHIEIFLLLSKRYPELASRRVAKLNRKELKEIFAIWYERNLNKIPLEFQAGINASAEELFSELEKL
ncbi:hypothetical protein EOD41_04380 [Mucilaginibacter limnophilus]|uniref:Uncharacterized protein n=1 Tax=Mucilaginibacter limnophilus TaxID=1932778 RepID=A0A437MU70_9SPHI|nr:hypothetical protein [Mucilaginibacter limnophilus]RVU01209.1 hypothetical protein EOD41_04380 [Mucilaginibacter limnophilus]